MRRRLGDSVSWWARSAISRLKNLGMNAVLSRFDPLALFPGTQSAPLRRFLRVYALPGIHGPIVAGTLWRPCAAFGAFIGLLLSPARTDSYSRQEGPADPNKLSPAPHTQSNLGNKKNALA